MTNANPALNIMPSGFKALPATDDEFATVSHLPYPSIAGAILYASTISRPDLLFTSSFGENTDSSLGSDRKTISSSDWLMYPNAFRSAFFHARNLTGAAAVGEG
jgi:hypothetical protein